MDDPPQISIVDDDPLVRSALCRLFKSAGYEVASFESAEEFLESERTTTTNCLVLDVHLPGRSGLELQSELRAATNPFPVVFVTAYEDEQAKTQALEQGAVEFLRKPLDTERLLESIERALKLGKG
jgi:FixJ family two-component response regulator